MSNIKNIKRKLIHVVCMIMLVLIQFDVCGYDLMRACHLADKPTSNVVNTADTCIEDNESQISEWSNPMYRGFSPRNLIKSPLQEFSSFIFQVYQRELSFPVEFACYFQAKLSNLTYLRFCVFRI